MGGRVCSPVGQVVVRLEEGGLAHNDLYGVRRCRRGLAALDNSTALACTSGHLRDQVWISEERLDAAPLTSRFACTDPRSRNPCIGLFNIDLPSVVPGRVAKDASTYE